MTTPQPEQPDTPQPDTTQPQTTQPQTTQPETVQPETSHLETVQPNPFAPPSTSHHAFPTGASQPPMGTTPPTAAAPQPAWPYAPSPAPAPQPYSPQPHAADPYAARPYARPQAPGPYGQPQAGGYGPPDAGVGSPFVRPQPYAGPDVGNAAPYGRPDASAGSATTASTASTVGEGARTSDSWWSATTPWPPAGTEPELSPARKPRTRRSLSVAWIVPLVLVSLLSGALGGALAARSADDDRPSDAALPVSVTPDAGPRPATSVAGLAASVLPSVVSIEVTTATGQATGSGFVLRDDGYLLTNNHVIAGGTEPGSRIAVTFSDGSEEDATIVGRTGDYDLAVIKVERTGLAPLALADSDKVAVGDPVVAIGAPLGLEGTVTTGIVSAMNRPVAAGEASQTAFINAIQTDAAINPGNSGGPLVNAAAEVIGINSAIAQPPGGQGASGSIGLGFAIPANQARRTAEQLMETGTATYPIIGVLLEQSYQGEGVQVALAPQNGQPPVTQGGPAANAGIRPGDVIVAIDGRPVTEPDELIVSIRAKAPGDAAVLRVRSGDGDERDVRVVLDEATSD
jgi:putative serine protease PepD